MGEGAAEYIHNEYSPIYVQRDFYSTAFAIFIFIFFYLSNFMHIL